MAWPAPSPGRSLEAEGNFRPREMTVVTESGLRPVSVPFCIRRRLPGVLEVHAREVSMRLFAGLAATALLLAACGGAPVAASPTPTLSPSPTPQTKFVFNADLKSSNEVPAIADAEASCSGKGVFTLNTTKDTTGKITAATAQFDLTITGCPTSTEIILFHVHKQVAGQNGGVVVDSGQKNTEP